MRRDVAVRDQILAVSDPQIFSNVIVVIVVVIVVIFVLTILFRSIRIIPQAYAGVV
jgi:hypothetical protein